MKIECFVFGMLVGVVVVVVVALLFYVHGKICHGLLKNFHAPAEDRTGNPSIYSLALYHVAIKAGLYRKAVQVYDIPNLYPVTFSLSMVNSSSNSQEYKNHLR